MKFTVLIILPLRTKAKPCQMDINHFSDVVDGPAVLLPESIRNLNHRNSGGGKGEHLMWPRMLETIGVIRNSRTASLSFTTNGSKLNTNLV